MADATERPGEVSLDLPKLTVFSLRDRTEEIIRDRLVAGALVPGPTYTIRSLAEELDVSPTPVREAVQRLSGEGALEIVRNRGFRVVEMDTAALEENLFMRRLLEVEALVEVSSRIDPGRRPVYDQLIDEMDQSGQAEDYQRYLAASRTFHLGLISELAMPRLTEMIGRLRDSARIGRVTRETNMVSGNREHLALVDAVFRGDGDEVRRLMIEHLDHHRHEWSDRSEGGEG